ADDERAWVMDVASHDLRPRLLPGREVASVPRLQIGLVDVEVFVPVLILQVEEMLAVALPQEVADAALLVGSDDAVILLSQGAHPDVQDAPVVRGQIGEPPAIRRDPRRGPLRVPEQQLAWNQRRERGFTGR